MVDPRRIKAKNAKSAPCEAFCPSPATCEQQAALRTHKNAGQNKKNHGFDHVDDRPRARADGGAQTIAPLVARKAAPPVPFSREKAPISVRPLHQREARLRRRVGGRPLRLVGHELGGHRAAVAAEAAGAGVRNYFTCA